MKKSNGFTLIELMIALAIGAILLTVAVPSFQNSIANNRVLTQSNELMAAFNIARLEAIKRGSSASVCTSGDGAACDNSGNWGDGFILFSDINGDGTVDGGDCTKPADDCVLRVFPAFSSATNIPTVADHTVTYNSNGRKNGAANFTMSIQPKHCSDTRNKTITISPTGRPEVSNEACK